MSGQQSDPADAMQAAEDSERVVTVQLGVRDAAHRERLLALLEKAEQEGYGVELRLTHYKRQPGGDPAVCGEEEETP